MPCACRPESVPKHNCVLVERVSEARCEVTFGFDHHDKSGDRVARFGPRRATYRSSLAVISSMSFSASWVSADRRSGTAD